MGPETEKALEILSQAVEGNLAHPGAGATRAVAIISAAIAGSSEKNRAVKKLTVRWDRKGGEFFPDIDMEFEGV